MFNHWYTWVLLIAIVLLIVYRKKAMTFLDAVQAQAADPAKASGAIKTPLANLLAQTGAADAAQSLLQEMTDKLRSVKDMNYGELVADPELLSSGSQAEIFAQPIKPLNKKVLIYPEELNPALANQGGVITEDGKFLANRDRSWWPVDMYSAIPEWNQQSSFEGKPYGRRLVPCGCGCGETTII